MPNRTETRWLSSMVRPPTLGPRRRNMDPTVERKLCSWIRSEFRLPPDTPIELFEWVSMDARTVPHTLHILVGPRHSQQYFVMEMASERVRQSDVRAATMRMTHPPLAPFDLANKAYLRASP